MRKCCVNFWDCSFEIWRQRIEIRLCLFPLYVAFHFAYFIGLYFLLFPLTVHVFPPGPQKPSSFVMSACYEHACRLTWTKRVSLWNYCKSSFSSDQHTLIFHTVVTGLFSIPSLQIYLSLYNLLLPILQT